MGRCGLYFWTNPLNTRYWRNKYFQGKKLNNATFEDETNQVFDNLEAICNEIGGTLNSILKLTIFLTDLSKFDTVNKIMESRFSEPFPARATVEISKLPKEVNIEMDAILSVQA